MKIRAFILAALLFPWIFSQLPAQPAAGTIPPPAETAMKIIHGDAIRAHMRFLADSLLEGRGTGTRGYDIAARYVQTELESMGLRPAGNEGGWYQSVPLRHAVADPARSSLVLVANGQERKLVDAEEYVLYPHMQQAEISVEAPIVFVGFGVTAANRNYDDYAGADVKGKIVAMIYGAPASFPATERAYYSSSEVKNRNALAHGAVGRITVLLPEDWKRYPWAWIVPQLQVGDMHWLDPKGIPHEGFPELRARAWLSEKGAAALFAGASRTLEQAFATARAGQPQAFPLPAVARIQTVATHHDIHSSNIIAVLPGSDPALRDQYVVYTAHVDHLGICPAVQGDNVCHGAVDNASGTAAVLEVARAFASLPKPPRRSVLFVFVTGEEMGLLGSDYFAEYPTVPRKSLVANVNIDGAPGIYYAMKDVVPLGSEHSTLAKTVEEAASALNYTLSPDPMPEEVSFIRSDQYSFVLRGIPAVDIEDGVNAVDPKINGFEVIKKWLTTEYHTPLDNMDQPLDYESAAKGTQLNFLVGYKLAEQPQPPAWNPGDFFGTTFGAK
jgi:hypothetical protein